MINFANALSKKENKIIVEPCELYDSLDRNSEAGPLRPSQTNVLTDWHSNHRKDKDIIIKLSTGAGKTLTGLLMALSYMYEEKSPALYVCPNIYLFQQTCEEARKFGVPYCFFDDTNIIPDDFLNSKKVLITYVQKVFNGLTVFGLDNKSISIGTIVLDDSHACIDSISSACTITIDRKRDSVYYDSILKLFESDLVNQGRGTYQDIKEGNGDALMMIPYWAWQQKIDNITEILSKASSNNETKFAWQILKNILIKCDAYISVNRIQISPECIPIKRFGTFHNAKHRVLMSATTQNDSFFIKSLGLSIDSVKNPIIDTQYKWSGEKMILIPSLMNSNLDDDVLITELIRIPHKDFGIVILTPSFEKSKQYDEDNSIIVNNKNKSNIYKIIKGYKDNDYREKVLVLANRYDGIDLADDSCRILIIDSLPKCEALNERYEEICRVNSEIISTKLAQKIEQALGRSVRGEKDYSVIIINGNSLVKFLQTSTNRKFFSCQTQQQIKIGFNIIEMSENDSEEVDKQYIFKTMKMCIDRNEDWKEYYRSQMNEIKYVDSQTDILRILELEKKAYDYYYIEDYNKACKCIQEISNIYGNSTSETTNINENSWYLQILAKYKYSISHVESEAIQRTAFEKNQQLLKPSNGVKYKKIQNAVDDNRNRRIIAQISKFKNINDFKLHVEALLDNLCFGVESETFEQTFMDLGELLGYICQRPDKMYNDGPDDLWCISDNKYISIECKSEVEVGRDAISKSEVGQLDQHFGWFKDTYGYEPYKNIIVIPVCKTDSKSHFVQPVKVLDINGLHNFVKSLKSLFKEFYKYKPESISCETIQKILESHGFNNDEFFDKFIKDIK